MSIKEVGNEFLEFLNWARIMYDENCKERWDHGQQPYATFEDYYEKNFNWLRDEFKARRVLQ